MTHLDCVVRSYSRHCYSSRAYQLIDLSPVCAIYLLVVIAALFFSLRQHFYTFCSNCGSQCCSVPMMCSGEGRATVVIHAIYKGFYFDYLNNYCRAHSDSETDRNLLIVDLFTSCIDIKYPSFHIILANFCRSACGDNSLCTGVLDQSTAYSCSCATGYYHNGRMCISDPSTSTSSTVGAVTSKSTVKASSTTTKSMLLSTTHTSKTEPTSTPQLSLSPTLTTVNGQSTSNGRCH